MTLKIGKKGRVKPAVEFVGFASYAKDSRPEKYCSICKAMKRWNIRYFEKLEVHTCDGGCGNQHEYSH